MFQKNGLRAEMEEAEEAGGMSGERVLIPHPQLAGAAASSASRRYLYQAVTT
jgi:hypothetical protein